MYGLQQIKEMNKNPKEFIDNEMTTTMNNIDKQMLIDWLGSDNTFDEALSILVEVAQGTYSPELLNKDIYQYKIQSDKEK